MTARKPQPQRPMKFGRQYQRVPPKPPSPRADDLPLTDWSSQVRCAGPCGQLRERGQMCRVCEYRAFEGEAS